VRRVNLARKSLDLTAGTEMRELARSLEWNILLLAEARRLPLIAAATGELISQQLLLSFRANRLSGFSAGDFSCQHS